MDWRINAAADHRSWDPKRAIQMEVHAPNRRIRQLFQLVSAARPGRVLGTFRQDPRRAVRRPGAASGSAWWPRSSGAGGYRADTRCASVAIGSESNTCQSARGWHAPGIVRGLAMIFVHLIVMPARLLRQAVIARSPPSQCCSRTDSIQLRVTPKTRRNSELVLAVTC